MTTRKLTIHLTDEVLDEAIEHANRHRCSLAVAVVALAASGAKRLAASTRYARSPKGQRTRKLAQDRRSIREDVRREDLKVARARSSRTARLPDRPGRAR